MPRSLRWLLFAVVLTALPVAIGVQVLSDDEPEAATPKQPAYESTPLTSYDTTAVALSRAPFCDQLPDDAVEEALAGEAASTVSYENGQPAELAPGLEDVAHEYGCRIVGRRGAEVRAWVFAPPIARTRAIDLVDEAAGRESCTRPAQAPSYGAPSVALVCPAGSRSWVSFRGLFGDAWLACSLAAPATVPETELLDRAGRWCVAVAQAAAAS